MNKITNPKLNFLRQKYKVRISHLRFSKMDKNNEVLIHARDFENKDNISPRGGATIVRVFDKNTDVFLKKGAALCSLKDMFIKKMGLELALSRAYQELGEQFIQ